MRYLALLPALLAPAAAHAQSEDLLGKYASAKIYCIDDKKLRVRNRPRRDQRPELPLHLWQSAGPAGSGLESTTPNARSRTRCGSRPSLSTSLTRPTMCGVKLPEKQDWITIYPCR